MTIEIRFATPDDAELIHRFICLLATYEREPDAVKTTPESFRIQLEAHPQPFECLIADVDNEPVGFALFFHNYSTWRGKTGLFLEDLFVLPERRELGVGGALLARLAQIAKDRGCARMEWMVLDWNRLAIDFYLRLGAKPLSDWTVFRLTGGPLDALADGLKRSGPA